MRQEREQRLAVPALVEQVGAEREVEGAAEAAPVGVDEPRARARCGRRSPAAARPPRPPSRAPSPARRVPPRRAPAPRGRSRARRRAARRAAPAARAASASAGGPELGPVRDELVVGKRLLVEERLRLARPQQRELEPADRESLLDEVAQSSASSPTVTPGGELAELRRAPARRRGRRRRASSCRGGSRASRRARRRSPPGGRRGPAGGSSGSARRARFAAAVAIAVPEGASSFVA